MVDVQALSKSFSDAKRGVIHAVRDVTFRAAPGRIFGLLGVNGAGKTTTLRMLSTVLQPGSGTATIGGYDVRSQAAEVRRRIGFVSNSTALYGRLTGREVLMYFGALYGLSPQDQQTAVESVADRLELRPFLDQLCDKMSTGQKQRTNLARAILHDPPVLFFDEPTAGLDVLASQSVLEFIESCRTAGKTVILSTHIMSEVDRLCDDVAIIHQGQIVKSGVAAEVLAESGGTNWEQVFLQWVGYQRGHEPALAGGAE